jgi:hypothetical protein
MGKASPPPPPDPRETSSAQTGTNVSTSIANAFLTNANENTPYGSRNFSVTGDYTWTDPYTNETYTVPRFTVDQSYTPEGQALVDEEMRARQNLATLGADLSGTLGNQLNENFTLNNESTEARLFDLGRKRLDPMFQESEEALRTRLANQGLMQGTEAYDRAMRNLGQQKNDAYNQLLLTGRGQASQEQLTEDNQRINQISALMSGGQVSQPNFTTGTQVNPMPITDNAALINNHYNQQMNAWSQRQAATGSMLSGLGTVAGGLFSLSDERVKEDKEKVGETDDGLGIYSYRMKGSPRREIGLMAQEVKKKKPRAVRRRPDGLMAVNYEKALR